MPSSPAVAVDMSRIAIDQHGHLDLAIQLGGGFRLAPPGPAGTHDGQAQRGGCAQPLIPERAMPSTM